MDALPSPSIGQPEVFQVLTSLGFEQPSRIQREVMPLLLNGTSVLALAPTGSGKTLAFLVPLLLSLDASLKQTQCLILVPTRELGAQVAKIAEQVSRVISGLGKKGPTLATAFGGQKAKSQKVEFAKQPQVVIATPGRALDLISGDSLNVSGLKSFVLDEADLMVSMGFAWQVEEIFSKTGQKRQVALFSATQTKGNNHFLANLSVGATKIEILGKSDLAFNRDDKATIAEPHIVPAEVKLDLPEESPTIHYFWPIRNGSQSKHHDLLECLTSRFAAIDSGLIFCQTRESVHNIAGFLKKSGINAEALSGDLGQIERSSIMRRFKADGIRFLVATNIAARGIDVYKLGLVVNFDLPSTEEDYLHRVGRTGRAGHASLVVNLADFTAENYLRRLLRNLKIGLERLETKTEPVLTYLDESRSFSPDTKVTSLDSKSDTEPPKSENKVLKFIRLHLNRGKSDKMRPGDILGVLTKQVGLTSQSVGNIFIYDHFIHVDVSSDYANITLKKLNGSLIKNKTVKARIAISG